MAILPSSKIKITIVLKQLCSKALKKKNCNLNAILKPKNLNRKKKKNLNLDFQTSQFHFRI